MSLTKATERMFDGTTISVRDYGATGDGSTDDTSAIQAAITAAKTASGANRVIFPDGDYQVTSINLVGCEDIRFVGEGNARLVGTSVGGTAVIDLNGGTSTASRRLIFDRIKIGLDSSASYDYAIDISFMTDSRFDGLYAVGDFDTAIVNINYSWNNNFYATELQSVTATGLAGIICGSNNVNNNNWYGGRIKGASGSTATGITARGFANSYFGLDVSIFDTAFQFSSSTATKVDGCYFELIGTRHFYFDGTTNNTLVTGSYLVMNNNNKGVDVNGATGSHKGVSFIGNSLIDNGSSQVGFELESNVFDVVLLNNFDDGITTPLDIDSATSNELTQKIGPILTESKLMRLQTGDGINGEAVFVSTGKYNGSSAQDIIRASRGHGLFTVGIRISATDFRNEIWSVNIEDDGTTVNAVKLNANPSAITGVTFAVASGQLTVADSVGSNDTTLCGYFNYT